MNNPIYRQVGVKPLPSNFVKAVQIATENGHAMLGWTTSIFSTEKGSAPSVNACRYCGATIIAQGHSYSGKAIDSKCPHLESPRRE